MRSCAFPVFATLALLLTFAPASAQPLPPLAGYAGGEILIAIPTGEFAENVGTGFGLGGHGRFLFDGRDVLSFRVDGGFINYGNETIRICVTQPCRVTGDLTTSNNIFFGALGPELGVSSGRARIYAHAGIGFAYFNTTSSVSGAGNQGEPFASSSNHDDVTFAWITGAGMQFLVRDGVRPIRFDLGLRYHGNGEAQYLRKGDIEDRPDGSVVINPRRSETNLWTVRIGLSVGIPRESDSDRDR